MAGHDADETGHIADAEERLYEEAQKKHQVNDEKKGEIDTLIKKLFGNGYLPYLDRYVDYSLDGKQIEQMEKALREGKADDISEGTRQLLLNLNRQMYQAAYERAYKTVNEEQEKQDTEINLILKRANDDESEKRSGAI